MTYRPTVYIASKVRHAGKWVDLRDKYGVLVISTWIDEAGPGQSKDKRDLWIRCVREASEADLLLAYREPGELVRGALVEIGAALAAGKQVMLLGDFTEFSWVNHPLVHQIQSMDWVLSYLGYLQSRAGT